MSRGGRDTAGPLEVSSQRQYQIHSVCAEPIWTPSLSTHRERVLASTMTKCSLFLVPLLVAIAVSDALQARAAGTLPRSATSVQDKATESTVSGKRALQSKEDTKGAADEERGPESELELLSIMMKSITDQMARTSKGASFSVSGVLQKDLKKAKAVVMKLEVLQSDLQELNKHISTTMTRERGVSEAAWKLRRWRITRLWQKI